MITDDDCTVPPNWLETFPNFRHTPKVAVACCVEAVEHDRAAALFRLVRTGDRMLTRCMTRDTCVVLGPALRYGAT